MEEDNVIKRDKDSNREMVRERETKQLKSWAVLACNFIELTKGKDNL